MRMKNGIMKTRSLKKQFKLFLHPIKNCSSS